MADLAIGGGSGAEGLLTPEEVAERLRVTRPTVYTWLKSGRLRGLRAGKAWRIRIADLESFVRGTPSEPVDSIPAPPNRSIDSGLILAVYRDDNPASEARKRLLQLPGGEAALEKVARIKAAQARFAHLSLSTDDYMREKQREIEWEERDSVA